MPAGDVGGLGARHPLGTWSERDVLQRAQMREERGVLPEQTDPPALRWHRTVEHATIQSDPTRYLGVTAEIVEVPGDRAEQRRLPRAVRSEHGEHLAFCGGDRRVECEAPDAGADVDLERHRTASARQPRMSRSTATATMMSSSDSAIAVSSCTPAPLKAV